MLLASITGPSNPPLARLESTNTRSISTGAP
jgi:hypothetical protein